MSLLHIIAAGAAGWKLPSGHFVPAKLTMEVINPVMGLTTGSNAPSYYYRCYPGIEWRALISVFGGAFPFHYEVIDADGLTGLTIGEDYGDTDYGILSCPSPSAGTYALHIRVTDQDETVVNLQWTLTVTTANAIFVDAISGNRTNSGTSPASALKEIYDWWVPNGVSTLDARNDATFQDHHVYYLAGTYYTGWQWDSNPAAQNAGQCMMRGFKPRVHVAYNGAAVIFDTSGDGGAQNNGGCFFHGDGNVSLYDIYYGGIQFDGYARLTNATFWFKTIYLATWAGNALGRFVANECIFGNQENGGVSGQNPNHIFLSDTTTSENTENISVQNCIVNDLEAAGAPNNSQYLVESYSTQKMVLENNTVQGTSAFWVHLIYMKVDTEYVSIRANKIRSDVQLAHIGTASNDASPLSMANIELCWNDCKTAGGTYDTHYQIGIEGVGDAYDDLGTIHVYRNSFQNGYAIHGAIGKTINGGPINYIDNVFQYDSGTDGIVTDGTFNPTVNRTASGTPGADDDLVASSGLLSATTNLLISDTYRGLKGHEVG